MPGRKRSRAEWEELYRGLLANAPLCACGCGEQVALHCGPSLEAFIRTRGERRYSRYIRGHQTRPANWKVELNLAERQAILGTLLGDSTIAVPDGSRFPRLTARHSGSQTLWAEHKARSLARLSMTAIERPDARYTGGTAVDIATPCLPCLDEIYALVAPTGAKQISREWLDAIGALGLAWWICDDGSSGGGSFTIATHGFTPEEVELAAEWFRDTYGPVTVASGRGYSWLYVSAAARKTFLPLVEPHIPECMQYKLRACRTREYRQWDLATALAKVGALREELGVDRYPTKQEFTAAGLYGLHQVIRERLGGHAAMAGRLDLPRSRTYWTPESATKCVEDLLKELSVDRYPTRREFARAGLSGLYGTIQERLGGHAAMAAHLGLQTNRTYWTLESATKRTGDLAQKLHPGGYPTAREFGRAGLRGLYDWIGRHLGGHAAMAARLGLPRPGAPRVNLPDDSRVTHARRAASTS